MQPCFYRTITGGFWILLWAPVLLGSPTITSISPILAHPGDIVKINGSGFDPNPRNNVVKFGPNRSPVMAATAVQLTVQVPTGQPLGTCTPTVSGSGSITFFTIATAKIANVIANPAALMKGCGCGDPTSTPGAAKPANLGGSIGGLGGNIYGERGELFQNLVDLIIPGRPGASPTLQFVVEREYRSMATNAGPLGNKWEHNYFQSLAVQVDGSIIHHHIGRNDRYLLNNEGEFVAPPEFYTTLVRNSDGSYTLTYNDRTVEQFDSTGKLQQISDRKGNSMSFSYNGQGQLATVVDTLGRPISYTYNSGGNLTNITDYLGRTVTYTYNSNGDLTSVTSPPVTGTPDSNNFPTGKTTTYTYDSNHRLLTITRPNEVALSGPSVLQNTYNSSGMIATQVYGGTNASASPAGGTYTYTYTPLNPGVTSPDPNLAVMRAQQTDRNGNVTQYDYNALGYPVVAREFTRGLRPTDPSVYVTTFSYNSDGRLTSRTMPAGNSAQYTYDDGNPDRFQEGNMLQETKIPDAARGGDQSFITTTYTYEASYNHIQTMTDPRGNDPSYVPQNGGTTSPARYTTTYTYDATGNLIHETPPNVMLPNSTTQQIVVDYTYNSFGQMTSITDPEGNVTQYSYCATATPSCPTPDPAGGGYLQEKTLDAATSPRRTETTPPAQITTQYFYDTVGNVIRTIDGRGNDTLYTYNQLNQIVETQSEAPYRYTVYTYYDANDNVIQRNLENQTPVQSNGEPTFSGANFSTSDATPSFFMDYYTYDILDHPVVQNLDATGSTPSRLVTTYVYDPDENNIRVTSPIANLSPSDPRYQAGNVNTATYDERDLKLTGTRGFGSSSPSTATFNYDLNRNLTQIVDARGFTTNYQYDGFDRGIHDIDAVGGLTMRHYDPDGNLISIMRNGQPGGPSPSNNSGAGDVLLRQRTFRYDEVDRTYQSDIGPVNGSSFVASGVTTTRPPSETTGPLNPGSISTQTLYDRNSRVVQQTDDDLTVTTTQYDGMDRTVLVTDPQGNTTASTYDANGNVIRTVQTDVSEKSGVANETFTTTYQYDGRNRVTIVSDNCDNTRRVAYDSRDNVTDTTDAKGDTTLGCSGSQNGQGNSTRYTYDGSSRLLQITQDLRAGGVGSGAIDTSNPYNPAGQITTQLAYDANGRLIGETDSDANQTTYTYDALDRLTAKTMADSTSTRYSFDAEDNIVATTDNNGTQQNSTYDAINRPIQATVTPAAGVIGTGTNTYQYDGLSRLTQATDNNVASDPTSFSTVTFAYDSLGRVVEESQNGHAVDSGWASQSQRSALTYPSNRLVNYTYDALERIRTIQDSGAPTSIAQYSYIGPQRVLQRQYQNGSQLTYLDNTGVTDVGYDPLRRTIQRRDLRSDNSLIVGFAHSYDREDNKTYEAKLHSPTNSELYNYDSTYRITVFDRGQLNNTNTAIPSPSKTQDWTLDGVGNWRVDTVNGVPATTTVDSTNEYTVQFLYDANGNMTYDAVSGIAYQWDYKNRLRQVCFVPASGDNCSSTGATLLATYSYDAAGRRTRKVVANSGALNGTRNFYYDDWRAIEERDGTDTLAQQYVFGIYLDEPVVLDVAGGPRYFYHQNTLSSTFALTDTSANVVEGYQYDAYGQPSVLAPDFNTVTGTSSAFGNPFMFTGQRSDAETGLFYFKNRYYSPQLGRFLSRDPRGYGSGMNLYEYGESQAPNVLDPMGLRITVGGAAVDQNSDRYKDWMKNPVYEEILTKMSNVNRTIPFTSMDDLEMELKLRAAFARCMERLAARGPGVGCTFGRTGTTAQGWRGMSFTGADPSAGLDRLVAGNTTLGCFEAGFVCAWVALRDVMEEQRAGSFDARFANRRISIDESSRNPLSYFGPDNRSLEPLINERIPGDFIYIRNIADYRITRGPTASGNAWSRENAIYLGRRNGVERFCGFPLRQPFTLDQIRMRLLEDYNEGHRGNRPNMPFEYTPADWDTEMPVQALRRINRNFALPGQAAPPAR